MTEWADNIPRLLLFLGIAILLIDIVVLGFSTFILFFLGVSLLLSAIIMMLGIVPSTWVAALLLNVILVPLIAAVLWRPLKRLQEQKSSEPIHNDFADHQFVLEGDVDLRGLTKHRYSGIEWSLKSEHPIPAGTTVEVERLEVGTLWIKAKR